MTWLVMTGLQIVAFILAVTLHECAHALAAYVLGDDTAKLQGRLSLNPWAHVDIVGLIFLIFFKFGWAKPVPIDPRNFRYPRLYSLIVSFAGPFSNVAIAVVALILYKYTHALPMTNFAILITSFLKICVWINAMLAVFNMIPIPPLDGSAIIAAILPAQWQEIYQRMQLFFFIILVIIISLPATQSFLTRAISGLVQLLSVLIL